MVFGAEGHVFFVEAVDFFDVVSQKGAEGVDFVAEFGDFGGAFLFLVFEFLLEFFDLKAGGVVFFAELALDRVVLNKLT